MNPTKLWKNVQCNLDSMFDENSLHVVAFSGGIDSMVLVELLHRQEIFSKQNVVIGHFVHIPNNSMDQAAHDVVVNYCWEHGLDNKLFVGFGSKDLAKSKCFESDARRARYNYFAGLKTAGLKTKEDRVCIYTAHHKNDQVETILLALTRGIPINSAPMGRSTLYPKHNIEIRRPLLDITRDRIKQYAQHNLSGMWHEDETNLNLRFERNFYRHAVIPLMSTQRNVIKTISNSVPTKDLVVVERGNLFDEE